MSYLIDTNVISEVVRANPRQQVVHWFKNVPAQALYLSALTIGEIRKGIERLPENARRNKLQHWLEHELPAWFGDRILPIDEAVSNRWGRLLSKLKQTPPAIDSLIAATALQHHLSLVTRNTKDFSYPGLQLINPWNVS